MRYPAPKGGLVGTGFWFDTEARLLLTALHVVNRIRTIISTTPELELVIGMPNPMSSNGAWSMRGWALVRAEIIREDPDHDLAILKANEDDLRRHYVELRPYGRLGSPEFGMALSELESVAAGEHIAVSGYPVGFENLVTTSGTMACVDLADSKATISVEGLNLRYSDCKLADVTVNPGNSGGPVYRVSTGRVIGVCQSYEKVPASGAKADLATGQRETFFYNSGLALVVPILYAFLLAKDDISEAFLEKTNTYSGSSTVRLYPPSPPLPTPPGSPHPQTGGRSGPS